MAHKFFEPNCTVYIWYPEGLLRGFGGRLVGQEGARIGHAAIQVSDGESSSVYLSFWGGDDPVGPSKTPGRFREKLDQQVAALGDEGRKLRKAAIMSVQWSIGGQAGTDGDADHEGTKPNTKFRFTYGLDWKAMAREANQLRGTKVPYSFYSNNCCHAVARVLKAGAPQEEPVEMNGYVVNVWQPHDVEAYCDKLMAWSNETSPCTAGKKSGTGEGAWNGFNPWSGWW
jgi:hypothetical protein